MFSLTKSARPHRRSRRQTQQLREAARAGQVELLEARTLLTVPELSSLEGAPVTVFLDFDGHFEDGNNGWGQDVTTPPFNRDQDQSTVSPAEEAIIRETWARVAEDFSPFDVNVTTVDPGSYNNYETILVAIGGDGGWYNSPGVRGIALLNSFSNSASNTVFVFSEAFGDSSVLSANIALTISHEAGHAFGLRHQSQYDAAGNQTNQYHPGTGNWGPIMGNPFGGVTRDVWHNGPSTGGANDIQEDMERLTRPSNRTFQFRDEDYGDSILEASAPAIGDNGMISEAGIISRHDNSDFFMIETDSGDISFRASTIDLRTDFPTSPNAGNNLDIVLRLYDSNGSVLVEDAPANDFSAEIEYSATRGTYYVEVTSIDEYGSAGQYTLDGDILPLPIVPEMIGPAGITSDATPTFLWSQAANTASYELSVTDADTGIEVIRVAGITREQYTTNVALPEGNYLSKVRQLNNQGAVSAFSDELEFEVDLNRPGSPTVTAPRGPTNDQTPIFMWDPATDAVTYELEVTNTDTDQVVIFRTAITETEYEHFAPLGDGNYQTVVVALNEAGERGAPSQPRNFSIDSDPAEIPQILTPGDDSTVKQLRPTIRWTQALNSLEYQLEVKSLSTNEIVIDETGLEATSFRPGKKSKLPQGTYVARVRGFNIVSDPTAWSDSVVFTVDRPTPGAFNIVDPTGTVGTQKPEFNWTISKGADRGYRIVITDKLQDDAEVYRATVSGKKTLSHIPSSKLPESELTVLIAGINSVGEVGEYMTRDFDIDIKTPARPKVIAPVRNANGTIGIPRPTFAWTAVAYANRYDFKLQNITTGEVVVRERSLRETSFESPTNLKDGNVYRVTVRARNTAGEYGKFSRSYDFETRFEIPSTPIMYGPVGNVQTRTPVFEWQNVAAATKIQLFIKDLNTNSTERISIRERDWEVSDDGTRVRYQLEDRLRRGTTYQSWVRAIGASSSAKSGYSNSVSFTIVSAEAVAEPADFVVSSDTLIAQTEEATKVPADTPNEAEPVEASIPQHGEPAAPVQPSVADTEIAPAADTTASAMAEFATTEWWAGDSSDSESEPTEDSGVGHLVEASAGLLAIPIFAGRLLKRVRNRRDKKRS